MVAVLIGVITDLSLTGDLLVFPILCSLSSDSVAILSMQNTQQPSKFSVDCLSKRLDASNVVQILTACMLRKIACNELCSFFFFAPCC